MCMSKGAPKKPSYGPCNERHGGITITGNYTTNSWANTATATTSTGAYYWGTSTANSTGWTIV